MAIVRKMAANDNGRMIDGLVGALQRAAESFVSELTTFTELEDLLLAASNEFVRRSLEGWLQALADSYGDEVLINNTRYRRHQPGGVRYFSLCGPLEVMRSTYRLASGRNGPTEVPVELQAGLIYRATPALAHALAQGHAKAPVRSVEQDLLAARRCPPSRSTMDRIGRMIGLDAHGTVEIVEPVIRAKERVPKGATAVNIGLDRTTIPMEEPDEAKDPNRAKPKIRVRYRMAYVGTVCVTDREGETLQAWRYAAPAHEGPNAVLRRMIEDVNHVLSQRPRLKLGVVQDGAAEMWNLLRDALRANELTRKRKWRETIDRYHLTERIAAALEAIYPTDEPQRRELLDRWRQQMDVSDGAVQAIRTELKMRARLTGRANAMHAVDDKVSLYVLCADHFHYASLKRDGLHSGSGVTEGACKFLITSRAKRSGQRWRERGIAAVLALRSLLASDRLSTFWELFAPRFRAECRSAA
jgi:hypothetical protein